MIELFKIAVELLLAIAVFVGGVLFAIKWPNAAAKIKAMTIDLFTKKAAS
jgi:hypothetical protein